MPLKDEPEPRPVGHGIAIIVPMLNEAATLPDLLGHLLPFRRQGCDIVLVDGGSTDASATIALWAGFKVISAPRGRARQMNAGAAAVSGRTLLFLHADTRLPANALYLLRLHMFRSWQTWGRFDVAIDGKPSLLRWVARLINLRSRLTGIATGDQALFIDRAHFDAMGGFPDQPLLEDIEMSRRLRRVSPPICIRTRVVTSGRRWEERGVWRTIFLMWRLRWAYWRGVSADRLAERYR